MPTKTISVRVEAYDRLKRARRYPGESFSQVLLRASWKNDTVTGRELLTRWRNEGSHLSEEEIDRVERADRDDKTPVDKWASP